MPGTSPSPEEARNFQEASRSATQYSKPSLRWDAAQRACRDGDLKTLKFIIEQAGIFEDKPALREACLSGAWGTGDEKLLKRPYSTQDSIRLHTLLQAATTRNHVPLVHYLLSQFPAKDLHVLEWETVVNAIAQASVPLLKEFITVDPDLVNFYRPETGNLFQLLFDLGSEKELHEPVVQFLLENGADPHCGGYRAGYVELARQTSTPEVVRLLERFVETRQSRTAVQEDEGSSSSGNLP